MRANKRAILAWLGLLLMAGSLVCLYHLPPREPGITETPGAARPAFGLVVLDAGHGGNDSGAVADSAVEKDLALDVAQRTQRLLHAQGFATAMTRERDEFVSLAKRADFANRQEECIFVSIHFNEGKRGVSTGVETYYADEEPKLAMVYSWLPFLPHTTPPQTNRQSQTLADCIQAAMVAGTQAANRGSKTEQFYVITKVWHPAVLVEGGFLSNKSDAGRLETPAYREELATAICAGIRHYRDVLQKKPAPLALSMRKPE